eukprot:gene15448-15823_t
MARTKMEASAARQLPGGNDPLDFYGYATDPYKELVSFYPGQGLG